MAWNLFLYDDDDDEEEEEDNNNAYQCRINLGKAMAKPGPTISPKPTSGCIHTQTMFTTRL